MWKIQLLKSICATSPSKCRMYAKSTFLVIDMVSLYKHMPKVGDNHWIVNQKLIWINEKKECKHIDKILKLASQAKYFSEGEGAR